MYQKHFNKAMLLIIVISLILSLPCVYANWQYGSRTQVSSQKSLSIAYFPWVGEEILPDDGDDDTTTQLDAIQIILDALNNKGLSGDSKLNQYISKRLKNFNKFQYGSVDLKQDPAELFSDITTIRPNFEFILEGVIVGSGNNKTISYFYLYMVDADAYNNAMAAWDAAVDSGEITIDSYQENSSLFAEYFYPVYRVKIERNAYDLWSASIAEEGHTGFGYYEGSNNGGAQKAWAFSPSSWIAGAP